MFTLNIEEGLQLALVSPRFMLWPEPYHLVK